jgi:hypothetical protein
MGVADGDEGQMGSDAESQKEIEFLYAVLQMVLRTVKDRLLDQQQTEDAHDRTSNNNTAAGIQLMHVALHLCQALLHLQSVSAEPMSGSGPMKS